MSNLGTLSFDVDLDLSKLKSKIDQQNEAVKQALEGLQVKVATKSVGELAQQIQSELNNHQFAIKLDEAKLSGLKSDIVSIAEKSKEIADNFARMGQGGGGTQQAVNIDLSKFNGISEIIEKIEGEMKRLYNVFADTTDGSGKQVAGLITNLSLLKDALEQLGTAAKNFTPTQQLNEAATAAQNVATATQNAAKSTKTASDEEAEATKKANIERERQLKLIADVQTMLSKVGGISSENTGLNPQRINEVKQAYEGMLNSLSTIPPSKSLQELSAELATLKANTKGFFQEVSQSQKAVESIRLVRYALKQVNEQMASGNTSPKLEGFREQLQAINREMHNLMNAGNLDGIQNLFAGHKGMSDGVVSIIRQMVTEMKKLGVATQETAGITSHLSAEEQKLAQSIQQSTNSMRGQSQILSDLKTMAMQYLSVWGAQSFIHNIIQTGGLLEQQRMSIGAILGDLSQANHLFGQIQQLALKSPFGVVQLDTMSKQLTAYNFKYSELYDWTKRLADISAATGTEVSRLSLALGHVRSEGALSGYTLRQFAMGNVPLLQTLAQQLGKTTSEIRKMTREKAITYDDVEKALRTLTDEGGIFFNAQEVMSNALNAKFKNMYDAFDIMFGKMAESGVGDVLKKVAETMTVLAKNWEQTGAVILSVAGYLGIHKVAMLANSKALVANNIASGEFTAKQIEMQAASGTLTKQMLLQAVATGKVEVATVEAAGAVHGLTVAQLEHVKATGKVSAAYNLGTIAASKYSVAQLRVMAQFRQIPAVGPILARLQAGWYGVTAAAGTAARAIGAFLKAFWPMLAISAVVEVVTHLIQKSNEAKERIQDLLQTAGEGFRNLEKDALQFKVGASVNMDEKQLTESIKEMEETLKSYLPNAGHGVLNEAFKIDPETGKSVHSLKEQYEMLAEELETTKEAYRELGRISDIFEQSNNDTDGWFDESFRENTEDYIDALKKRNQAEVDFIANNRQKIVDVLKETRDAFWDYDAAVTKGITLYRATNGKEGFAESDLKAQIDLLKDNAQEMQHVTDQLHKSGGDVYHDWVMFQNAISGANVAMNDMYADMKVFNEKAVGRLEATFGATKDKWTEAQKLAVQKAIEIFMTGIDGYSSMAEKERLEIEQKLLKDYNITVNLDAREANKAVTELQAYLTELVGKDWVIKLKLQGATTMMEATEQIEKGVKAAQSTIDKFKDLKGPDGKPLKKGKDGKYIIPVGVQVEQPKEEVKTNYAPWGKGIKQAGKDAKEGAKDAKEAATNIYIAAQEYNNGLETIAEANKVSEKTGIKFDNKAADKAAKSAETAAKKEQAAAEKANKKAIEEQKTQLEEVKKFYAEYKKYREVFGAEKGQSIVEDMFGMKAGEGDRIIKEYDNVLDEIQKKLEELGDKKGVLAIKQLKAEINLDKTKKEIDKAISDIQEYISKKSEKFNLYKALLEKTGSKDFAKLAFEDGKIWDDLSKELAEKLKEAISSAGAEIDINTLWDKSDAEAQEMLKGVNGAYDLWKKIVELISGNYTEALNKGADAMANNLTATQKLQKLQKELVDLQEEYNKTADAARRKSLEAQIKAKKKEVDKQKIEVDNQDVETLQFYSAILSMTAEKAEVVGRKLRENLVEQLKAGTISGEEYVKAIKKIDQQIENLREEQDFLSAWQSGGIEGVKKLELDVADDELTDSSNRLKDAQDKLREAIDRNTEAETEEERQKTQEEVEQAQQAVKDAEKNHEIAQKNQDTATKNYQSAKKFNQTVAAIAYAVQAMVQAFNDAKQAAAAYGEDLDADMDSFGQHYMGILEGLNTGLSRMQQGDFAGAISGAFFGSIASIAQKHDATLKEDIQNSQLIIKRYDNLIDILEKRLDNTLGGVYAFKVSQDEIWKLYDYLGKIDPKILERMWNGTASDEDRAKYEDRIIKDMMAYGSVGIDGTGVGKEIGEQIAKDTYEAIMKAIESESYYDTKYAELLIQRDELQRQLADAEGMKDRDEGQIEDYKQQLLELQEDIDNFAIDMAKALYDIDVQDWASKLTDAIVGAWESGEDAVEAYNKAVKDMMKDLTKNIIAKKILEKALADVHIDKLIEDLMKGSNGVLDENAVVALGDALMGAGQSATTATIALLDYLETAGYIEKSAEVTKTAFDDLRSTFLDTLTDIESNAEDFKKNLEQIMIKDVIEKQVLDVPFTINGMTFENFDAYLKNWNERYASAIKAGNQALIDALIDELVQAREITIKAAEELRERLKSVEEDTTFSDMSDSWVTNLMDMSKTAEDWAEEVGKTMAEKIIKEMIVPTLIQPYLNQLQQAWNNALPQYTTTDENGNKSYNWEGLLGDSAVRGAIKAITAAYPAASEAVKTVLEKLDIDISNYKYSGFSNLADSIIDSLKSADGSLESWAEDQGKKMAEQMAQAYIDQNYGEELTKLNEEWQQALEEGDAEAIATVEAKLNDLYKRMANDPDLMNLIDDFKELDTTVTGLSDSFVSSLMDMSKSARDWSQDLANTIAEAVIKMTVVPTLIKPLLQGVQDVFDGVVESATSIDDNGKKTVSWETIINSQELKDAINGVVKQYPQLKGIVEQILSAFDVDMYENPFSDMASEFTSSLMDMEQSAADFANSISRMLTEQMINKVITSQFQGEIDALGEMWREALEGGDVAAIEYIKQQLVELREKIGDAVQPLLDSISDIGKQADKTFSSMTDSWVSALMDMEGSAEDFAQEVGKTMVKEIITRMLAPKFLQPILDAMQQAFNLAINAPGATVQSVMQQMKPYLSQITSVYNEIFPMIQELFDGFGIVTKSVEEAAEEVEYALQDLKSNFVSSLMDMENSAEDFSKEISKILAQSFIEKFVLGDKFDAQMKYWQEQYESIIGSGMSEDERKKQLKALRDAIAAAKEGYVNNAMAIMDLLGLTTEDSQKATMNMADKITYDQADQLLGINLAQELTLEQILAFLKGKDMDFTPIYDSLVSNTASQDEHSRIITSTLQGNQLDYNPVLDSIVSQTTAQDEHSRLIASTLQTILDVRSRGNDNILTQVAISNNHLYAISEYTKKMRDEVVMHLGSMDDKLTNLKRL